MFSELQFVVRFGHAGPAIKMKPALQTLFPEVPVCVCVCVCVCGGERERENQ